MTGYFISGRKYLFLKSFFPLRIAAIVVSSLFLCFFFYSLLIECKETITLIMQTVYPGNRISTGGNLSILQYFSGYYELIFYREGHPPEWGNFCEASNFLLIFPFIFLLNILHFVFRKKINILELSLIIYILLISVWALWGMEPTIAKILFLYRIPSNRVLFGVGIANIFLVIIFLSRVDKIEYIYYENLIIPVITLASLVIYSIGLKNFFSTIKIWHIILISLLFSSIVFLLLNKKKLIFSIVLLTVLLPNFFINPISTGLSPIFDKKLARVIQKIIVQDKEARWIVFGDFILPNFPKALGANVFNGVKYLPDLKRMKILDRELKNKDIYNRYAHIQIIPLKGNNDFNEISFDLVQADLYSIFLDPASVQMEEMNFIYFVFTSLDYIPPDSDFLLLARVNEISIYKFKGKDSD